MRSTARVCAAGLGAAAVAAAAAVLAGCSSTTHGSGAAEVPTTAVFSSSPDFPIAPATSEPAETTAPVASTSATSTIHPVPGTPERTATVHTAEGRTYLVKIWWDVKNDTCFDHAYGQPIVTFLTVHPCVGLERYLATTTVNGRPVAFAMSSTGFRGTPRDLYGEAARFIRLEQADGTGSLDDLLREGYQLPSGPTSVPAGEAFSVLGQDQGVTVWDVWYLDGSTPANDPALVKMTQDLFLQF